MTRQKAARPVIRAAGGWVRGSWDAGVAVFRGIPFAEPPVAALRFAAPRPVRGWSGTRDALAYGPPPPQGAQFGMDAQPRGAGDDWLTINVWTPAPEPGAGLAVMVWIQGGGYLIGMSSLPEYDGARLARDGDVIVVTFNYRVGVEGFAHVQGAPDNRGLLDQVAALEWVRGNIAAFGGDSQQVTIFGQSAGGGCIAALLAMDRATGLFRQAVAQSVPGTFFTADLAKEISTACAAELGLRPTVTDLAMTDPLLLAAAADEVAARMPEHAHRWGQPAHRSILFSPVVDREVLGATPWQALSDGAARDIALVVGHTRNEHRLFTVIDSQLGEVTQELGEVTQEQAANALQIYAPLPGGAEGYREVFPGTGPEELYELVSSDWLFRMPSLHLAEAQVRGGGRAHVYELTWPAPGLGGIFGACHGLDVPLVFGNLDRGQPAMLIGTPVPAGAELVSRQLRDAWVAFARDGEPGWPAYDTRQRLTRLFDVAPVVVGYPEERSRRIWQQHRFNAFDLVGPWLGTSSGKA